MMQIRTRAFQMRQKSGIQTLQTGTCIKVLYTWKNDRKTVHESSRPCARDDSQRGSFLTIPRYLWSTAAGTASSAANSASPGSSDSRNAASSLARSPIGEAARDFT